MRRVGAAGTGVHHRHRECQHSRTPAPPSRIPGSFPLVFHAVEGEDMREGCSPSWFNPTEVAIVRQYVQVRQYVHGAAVWWSAVPAGRRVHNFQ